MKIICDCGNEAKISIGKDGRINFNDLSYHDDNCSFDLSMTIYEEFIIKCNKCGKEFKEYDKEY